MIHISKESLNQTLSWDLLIPAIRSVFSNPQDVPQRHHHQYPSPKTSADSTLLLMPAWGPKYLGIKVITVSPENGNQGIPSVQGTFTLLDVTTGTPLASMDAQTLTTKRTAATSALVSSLLSRQDSSVLLMIGSGALAPELIRAHSFVRPIKKVLIWGRNVAKAKKLALSMKLKATIEIVDSIEEGMAQADIVSSATLSTTPLILGANARRGQHIDLVGSFKPDMREADDDLMRRSSIYVDTVEACSRESGDILKPLENGVFAKEDIMGDLFSMCESQGSLRSCAEEITCFKSVGHALEDLAAAGLAYESL